MRLAYLAPAVLGLFLVGCGAEEPEEVETPPVTEQPQAPATPPATPPAGNDSATDTMPSDSQADPLMDPPGSENGGPATDQMQDPLPGGATGQGTTSSSGQ